MEQSINTQKIESQIELFRRQFLQLEEPHRLILPSPEIVKRPDLQAKVYNTLFREGCLTYPPPNRYKLRVLKVLVEYLEHAAVDPQEDEISDDLTSCLAGLLSQPELPESIAAQQRTYVTYTSPTSLEIPDENDSLPALVPCTVTLLESRALMASSGTTGLRTWEAALRLGMYLVSRQTGFQVRGKNVLELGAGTGFVSILCAKHLNANYVLATDGSGDVVDAIAANMYLNGLDLGTRMEATVLKWGHALIDEVLDGANEHRKFDLVLGADITYDELSIASLVATMDRLIARNQQTKILISATVRNEATVAIFVSACNARKMTVENLATRQEVTHGPQLGFFHPNSVDIRIYLISPS